MLQESKEAKIKAYFFYQQCSFFFFQTVSQKLMCFLTGLREPYGYLH